MSVNKDQDVTINPQNLPNKNEDKKVTDSNDSNNSTSSNTSKSKSFKDQDIIKGSNYNLHNNSIAVMYNIDDHKTKSSSVSKKSTKSRKPWYSVSILKQKS